MRAPCTIRASCCSRRASSRKPSERIRASLAIDPAVARCLVEPRAGARGHRPPRSRGQCAQGGSEARADNRPTYGRTSSGAELAIGRTAEAEASARRAVAADATHAQRVAQPGAGARAARRQARSARRRDARRGRSPATCRLTPATRHSSSSLPAIPQRRRRRSTPRSPASPATARCASSSRARSSRPAISPARPRRTSRCCASIPTMAPRCRSLRTCGCASPTGTTCRRCARGCARACRPARCRVSPFVLLSQPATPRGAAALRRMHGRPCSPRRRPPSAPRLLSGARLRLGYLSADFHTHATAFLAAGMFEQHDRRGFEVVAYSTGPDDRSPLRARVVRAFDRFVDATAGACGASPMRSAPTASTS